MGRWVAVVAAVVLVAGCSSEGDGQVPTTTTTAPAKAEATGLLEGLDGTAPLADVPPQLLARLNEMAPTMGSDAPAAIRPYDSVIVAALATEVARSDAPSKIAGQVGGVTVGGDKCTTFASCRDLSDPLIDLDYDGPSGEIDLLADGQSGDAAYGVYQFGPDDRLTKVSSESAEVPPPAVTLDRPDPTTGPRADGVLHVAMVLPTAGPTARLAEAARAGVRVAVDELNQSGGVLGVPVQLTNGDAGDGSAGPTQAAVAEAVTAGADVVIGGIGADDTTALVDPVTSAGLVLISPGSAGTIDAPGATSGLFFRLSPPVSIQGDVLASAVADDGVTQATIIYEDDPDGRAIDAAFGAAFAGLDGTVAAHVAVPPGETAASVIDRAVAVPTGGYVIVGDDSAVGDWLADLRGRDLDPLAVPTYVANISPALLDTAA
jgi:hypothetical protein